jgi:hypothetical protein
MAGESIDFKLYRYDPSMAAAVIFVLLFLSISVVHAYQLIRTRAWIFIAFVIGGFCKFTSSEAFSSRLTNFFFYIVQCIGYAGVSVIPHYNDKNKLTRWPIQRAKSAAESPNWTIPTYSLQTILILVAPALFAASIYMILGRIIVITDGEIHAIIRKKWLTKIFVTGDVISFIMQGAGKSFVILGI